MTLDEYQEIARSTAIYPTAWNVVYPILGMTGEAGETANKLKKYIRKDNPIDCSTMPERVRLELKDELGDVLWYIANALTDLGYTLDECAKDNAAKLHRRSVEGTLAERTSTEA